MSETENKSDLDELKEAIKEYRETKQKLKEARQRALEKWYALKRELQAEG